MSSLRPGRARADGEARATGRRLTLAVPAAVGGGLVGGLALAALGMALFGEEGARRYVDLPIVEGALPPAPATAALDPIPPAEPTAAVTAPPVIATAPPAEADPALLEAGPHGPLPRIAPDGRRPWQAYARQPQAPPGLPRLALLVGDLGLQADAARAALALAPELGLVFTAYAGDLEDWLGRARRAGHEVYLALPLEPAGFPDHDPGPHTLRADGTAGDNAARLDWLLAQGTGYVGLAGAAGRFAGHAAAPPVLETLAARGVALIELGGGDLANLAQAALLPYARADGPLDDDPRAAAIDDALEALERRARSEGAALGVVQPYPVSFERLGRWLEGLSARGVRLVPPSALIRAGAAERPAGLVRSGDG